MEKGRGELEGEEGSWRGVERFFCKAGLRLMKARLNGWMNE